VSALGHSHDFPPSTSSSWTEDQPGQAPSASDDSAVKAPTIGSDDASYRDYILKHHGIIVLASSPPATFVKEKALEILNRERDDDPTANRLMVIGANLAEAQDSREAKLTILISKYFPDVEQYMISTIDGLRNVITTGTKSQWKTDLMPYKPGRQAVVAPKTDLHYGFTIYAFAAGVSDEIITHERIGHLAHANPDNIFPFLLIEFKAEITRGTLRHAADQAASAGALSINALRQFLCLSHADGYEPPMLDTIHFSCVLDAKVAEIWVHWFEEETFRSAIVARSFLQDTLQLIVFLRMLKNIVDWGFNTRLPLIRDGLVRLVPAYHRWTSEAQLKGRSRRGAPTVV